MTVVLRHNPTLELNLAEYRGPVALGELRSLAEFMASNPVYLRQDTLNLIHPGADFPGVTTADLDALFDYYRVLFAPLQFTMLRRAAWVCLSPKAQTLVRYWVEGRDMKGDMSSAVRCFSSMAEAGDWLVLSEDVVDTVRRGDGFSEVTRFNAAAATR